MGSAIAEVVPSAVGLLLVNLLPLTAVILLLFSPRAKVSATAFVAGWMLGMSVVFGILLWFVPLDDIVGDESDPSTPASIARLLLGMLLLYLAARQWRKRPGPEDETTPPPWMLKLEQASPLKALGIGASLSGLNPKNLAFTVSAVVSVAQAELATGAQLVPVAVYILIASAGVAAPVIWYLIRQERAAKILAGWRIWLAVNYVVMMTVVLLVFGVVLAAQAIGDLFGS